MTRVISYTARLAAWSIRNRILVCIAVALTTAFFAASLSGLDIRTRFSDMVPHDHPYVQVHNKYQDSFPASNRVTILVKAPEGEIFTPAILEEARRITYDLQKVEGVNRRQTTSLAPDKPPR